MHRLSPLAAALLLAALLGCPTNELPDPAPTDDDDSAPDRPDGWTEQSHGDGVAPDHDGVFAQGVVQRLDIEVGADNWAAMQDDLDDIVGDQGGPPDPPGEEAFEACEGLQEGDDCQYDGDDGLVVGICRGPPQGEGPLACIEEGGGQGGQLTEDPMWVPVTVSHEGLDWTWTGMRFKGNSSLKSSWSQGTLKLPFRLDFDQYEDEHPETDDQRFFGFKKLTFAPGFKDPSYVRDTLMGELMRDFGLPSATTAFYEIWLDLGDGPLYAGLYTAIEDPSDAMMDAWFEDGSGNLYKPDVPCGSWACFAEDSFPLKSGEGPGEHADILAAIDALEADSGDAEAWRAGLEEVFDAASFMSWLAANNAAENWDAYGVIAHNYYLYGDPSEGGRLTWIPWDQNEGLAHWDHGAVPEDLQGVSTDWPVIRELAADPVYYALYLDELERTLDLDLMDPDTISDRANELHDLIRPFVEAEQAPYTQLQNQQAFEQAVDGVEGLSAHVEARRQVVEELLGIR